MSKCKLIILLAVSMFLVTGNVVATPKNTKGKIQETSNLLKAYKKIVNKLSKKVDPAVLKALLDKPIASGLEDSDSDGLPDILEHSEHTNACDSDSDDDGIDDGDEGHGGSDPGDDEEGEINTTGAIAAITSTTVTVGVYTCTVDGLSDFGDQASLSDYEVGDNVELECELKSNVLTLKSISEED